MKFQISINMKKTFIIIAAFALALCSCGGNTKSTLFKSQATRQDVVPNDCETVCFEQGDLNDDGIQDLVVGVTPRNTGKPVLAVYFGNEGGQDYTLFKEYTNTLPVPEDELTPFSLNCKIPNYGALEFEFEYFNTAGVVPIDKKRLTYIFEDGDFYLMIEEWESHNRITGEFEEVSRNYQTCEQQTLISGIDDDGYDQEVISLPSNPLEKLGNRMLD